MAKEKGVGTGASGACGAPGGEVKGKEGWRNPQDDEQEAERSLLITLTEPVSLPS
jgi:hypothetical protein